MIKLICGRSNAGKTTYSERYEDVIHLDYCGGIKTCYDGALKKVAGRTGDVVIEGVYNTAERRKALLEAYAGSGEKVCVWLDTPIDVIKKRTWEGRCFPSVFDPPAYDEGWDEIIINRDGIETVLERGE